MTVHLQNLSYLPLDFFMIPAQIILALVAVYFFILGMSGLVQFRVPKVYNPQKKFAVVIPAHNEELVISSLIDNLMTLDYPKKLYDVFVIADNCNDNTANMARSHGAIVYERTNLEQKGKGYALEWFFAKLYNLPQKYDAVVIFDADNLVDPYFLKHMNNRLCDGAKIVQGYIDAKNPQDTWVTASFAMAFWVANRMLQLARYNLGLSNYLGGTGMAISLDVLREIGWGATSLTEDLEFSLKALLHGYKTTWAHEAVVYDEKPLTFKQAWNQRKRWALGHVELFRTYSFRFIKEAIRQKNIVLFDASILTLQPLLVVFMALFTIVGFVDLFIIDLYTTIFKFIWPPLIWELVSTLQIIYPFLVIWLDRLPRNVIKWIIIHYPIFVYSWVPIIFLSFFGDTRVAWSHTLHTRNISYADINNRQR
ncbi:MAG TPA: glycosyltransferase family 2 protein [Clostridia bacterium]|jgi:cellulose synthase/poly-beta-1,6-N-acetylglucosamine synthase-like glycosyltransferase|nr:glycosyltransferase family 2 protein [Clostridia bacterium]HHY06847.1 glycosyltransferase family 2 protein [Clostridia bacterium]